MRLCSAARSASMVFFMSGVTPLARMAEVGSTGPGTTPSELPELDPLLRSFFFPPPKMFILGFCEGCLGYCCYP